jgi:hypothetical protein
MAVDRPIAVTTHGSYAADRRQHQQFNRSGVTWGQDIKAVTSSRCIMGNDITDYSTTSQL